MTAGLNEGVDCAEKSEIPTKEKNDVKSEFLHDLPQEIMGIFEFLSVNKNIIFKSQQIDDPDIERDEKIQIARSIYTRNRQLFLMRFGSYLNEQHLDVFFRFVLSEDAIPLASDENGEEMQIMLGDYQRKLQTRKMDIKNRRYVALQHLEKQGEYFSEQEMMKRAPLLYQELIGQYLTEAEKKNRDSYDVKNTTFSGILMHSLERQQLEDVLKKAEESHDAVVDEENNNKDRPKHQTPMSETLKSDELSEDDYDEVPSSFRTQWGTFDNEKIECSSSRKKTSLGAQKNNKKSIKNGKAEEAREFITAGERDLLRKEFIELMHEQFLSGQDCEFDYTQVDDNSMLDDLNQLNQDKEDAYFEESDSEDEVEQQIDMDKNYTSGESADELDIYMNHLSKHHSLCN